MARTTLTLDDDVEDKLKRQAERRGISFKEMVNTALRNGLEAPDAAQAKEQVGILKKAFGDAEAFFKARGTADATGWAGDALKLVTSMEQAVAATKWDDVKGSVTTLTQLCQTCHTAHRERLEDGTFRIKGESR